MTREQAEAFRTNDKYWWFGVVYICKEDPRFIIRNRWFFAWTWNFENLKMLLALPIFILIFISPLLIFAPAYGLDAKEVVLMTAGALLVLVIIANYVASGPR